jgi:hypothetical protein
MGLLMSLPLAGGLASIATSCIAGLAFCFTSNAGQFLSIKQLFSIWLTIAQPRFSSNLAIAIRLLQPVLDLQYVSFLFFESLSLIFFATLDYLLAQFYSCLDHEDGHGHKAHPEVEFRLH